MKVFFARIELSKQTLVVDFFELQSFFLLSLSSAHISVVNWGKTQNVVWRISKKLGIPSGRPQRHLLHNRLLRLLGARQEGSTPHSTLWWHRLSQLSGLFPAGRTIREISQLCLQVQRKLRHHCKKSTTLSEMSLRALLENRYQIEQLFFILAFRKSSTVFQKENNFL